MFTKDAVFGESVAKKFDIGDIVSWPCLSKTDNHEKIKKLGIISRIEIHKRSERPVVIAKVIDFESSKELDILIISLSLIAKGSKEIQN